MMRILRTPFHVSVSEINSVYQSLYKLINYFRSLCGLS
jgi:hypothetical protein